MPGMGFGFGFGFHRRASGSGASASATLLTLATAAGAEAVYDPDNEDTWTLRDDGADLWYSAISDGLGNREDMVQATAANQPKQITLSTGRRAMLADTTQGLLADFAADISQPNTVVLVWRMAESLTSTLRGRALDSENTTARQILGSGGPSQPADIRGWNIWAGTWLSSDEDLSAEQNWNFQHGNYNGASSEIFLNGVSVATGDAGTNGLGGVEMDFNQKDISLEYGPIIVFTGLKTNAELSDIKDHIDANWPIGSSS